MAKHPDLKAPTFRRDNHDLMATAQRRQIVLDLKVEGMSYTAIERYMNSKYDPEVLPKNYNRAYICADISAELKRVRKQNEEVAERLRELELARCDKLLNAVWEGAMRGDVKKVHAALRILERRARYLPVELPDQLELGNINGEPFEVGIKPDDFLKLLPDDKRRQVIAMLERDARGGGDSEPLPDSVRE